jgi:WD40 repeat protein
VNGEGKCNLGEICLWNVGDVDTGGAARLKYKPIKAHTTAVYALAFSRDDRVLASGSGGLAALPGPEDFSIQRWDVGTGKALGRPLLEPPTREDRHGVTALAFHPVSDHLVSADDNGAILVWDWKTGSLGRSKPLIRRDHIQGFEDDASVAVPVPGHAVLEISFTPQGERLLSASDDGTIAVLEWLPDGYFFWPGVIDPFVTQAGRVQSAAFTPLGTGWATGSTRFRDLGRGEPWPGGKIATGQVEKPAGGDSLHLLSNSELVDRALRRANRTLTNAEESEYLRSKP